MEVKKRRGREAMGGEGSDLRYGITIRMIRIGEIKMRLSLVSLKAMKRRPTLFFRGKVRRITFTAIHMHLPTNW